MSSNNRARVFFGGMFALVSRDAHPLNPALSVEARREVYLCLLSVWKPRPTACDKAYFCHDKFGASETWRDVFISRNRIGKTRAKKEGKRRTREEGGDGQGEGRRERGRKSDTEVSPMKRGKEAPRKTEGERIAFLEIPVSLLRRERTPCLDCIKRVTGDIC